MKREGGGLVAQIINNTHIKSNKSHFILPPCNKNTCYLIFFISEYYVQAENIKKGCRGEGDSVEGGGERTPEVQVTLYQPEVPKQRRDERKASSSPLLLARAAGTEIIITPTSRGNSVSEMSDGGSESVDLSFLCPDLDTEN